ncbi:hypothetical protein AS156_07035 [Bradyrhizobium macuxiense]|uniref:Ubiquitin-like protease family profile domain-containing protein n=1 Tax=Bradyrhizobium macuxiense TaxID=1755647 RepID=A0A120FN20_9BRAD|nr:Ulp1 family isopeptidase [Bradyrhizobium macuxiense]KWV54712.1 hypothetical protein AS156_07035 [Bradyrhizobium macuxiense]
MADVEGVPKQGGDTSSLNGASTSAIPTKSSKGCGLWWCFKSAFAKSFRRSRRETSAGRLDQPAGQPAGSRIPPQPLQLGPEDWLGDEHITADYTLLERELQSDNPDLAARTRLLRPAQAHLLRLTEDDLIRQDALWGIIEDGNNNDTANYLFLPVNDGSSDKSNDGTHWSLLLVDRRDPGAVVAYHYDSFRKSNSAKANQLAARLGASLQTASITEQRNHYDCGVFVLDATRALVGRLAQTERTDDELLRLDNLVANRRALQDRLSAYAPL